jgi:hypothetical protein
MPNLIETPAPAPAMPSQAPIILPPDVLAALRKMDANPANWETVNPDQFKGFSDATGDEEGLD